MTRVSRLAGFVLTLVFVATACTGDTERRDRTALPVGGTLRIGMAADFQQNLDPHKEYLSPAAWELYRCCLLRTLLSYRGRPTEERGTVLFPDLAVEMPDISDDGLTWTFSLKRGLRYAPPMHESEIVARDIIRGLERAADPVGSGAGVYSHYYSVIEGFDEAATGKVDSISGLLAPDDYTLVVRLVQPAGDLGYRLSLPAAAPIPSNPFDPDARLGVAEGHGGNYGQYLVASGPYMFEGSEDIDFSKPPLLRPGVAGFRSGTSVTLVQNPSWSSEQDPLRPAYAERIEITNFQWRDDFGLVPLYVEQGRLDLVFDANPPPDQLDRYRADEDLENRVFQHPSNTIRYLTINTALPPFDDPHVRRAVAFAIDRMALVNKMREVGWFGETATHLAVDSLEEGLFAGDEFLSGGVDAALREMARSAYDHDRDGVCDDSLCIDASYGELYDGSLHARLLSVPVLTESIRANLARIGITLADDPGFPPLGQQPGPSKHMALVFGSGIAWQADYPNATTFFASLYAGARITEGISGRSPNLNTSLLGATPAQLAEWGYPVDRVPNVDNRITRCVAMLGSNQARCWAELDQYLMSEIVPAVPIATDLVVRIVSDRVVNYSFDQFTAMPALDHIALAPASA